MELTHVDLPILVSVGEADKCSEVGLRERNVQHCEDHFEFHVREDAIAIGVESGKRLLDVDALFL